MSLYTKVGDKGETRLPDGGMISKDHPRIAAIGGIDELNANIGLCIQAGRSRNSDVVVQALEPVQSELFAFCDDLAATTPQHLLTDEMVRRMERQIDEIYGGLPPLRNFILPGGSKLACLLHVARTVCRRAERGLVRARQASQAPFDPIMLKYINRLSDLMFALAGLANHQAGVEEKTWSNRAGTPGRHKSKSNE